MDNSFLDDMAEAMLNGGADDNAPDYHRNQPRPNATMLYGLAGDVGNAAAKTTEANPYAVAANFMAYLSAMVGREVYLPVGNTWHHCRLFTLHIGRTGRGRKGDAVSIIRRIRHALSGMVEADILGQVHIGGLSTREGLALMIHDGYSQGKEDFPAIEDKRLWAIESEFANILHQSKRDGNTLSAALRDAWDGVSIRPAIKSSRVWATDPHVALSGAITPSELRAVMQSRELTNGFANRFLMFWAERQKLIPFPEPTPQPVVDELARRTAEVIRFAKGGYPESKDTRRMSLSEPAAKRYRSLYRSELSHSADGEQIGALMERRAPMLLRIAMLFALTDLTLVIDEHHIEAALAWVRYWRESVKFVFSEDVDEVVTAARNETAERLVAWLKLHGETPRTSLMRDCFKGHLSADKLDDALSDLLAETPPRIEVVDGLPRSNGPPAKLYRVCELGERSEAAQTTGASASSRPCETSEVGAKGPDAGSPNSQVRESAETRMDRENSPSSPASRTSGGKVVEVEI